MRELGSFLLLLLFFFFFEEKKKNEEVGGRGGQGEKRALSLSVSLSSHLISLSENTHLVAHQERRVPLEDPRRRHAHGPLVDLDSQQPRPLLRAEPFLRLREPREVAEEDVGRRAVRAEGVVLVLADEDDLDLVGERERE